MTSRECLREVYKMIVEFVDGPPREPVDWRKGFVGFVRVYVPDLPVDVEYGCSKNCPTPSDSVG